jgi:autotransporter-associated beta strand protein
VITQGSGSGNADVAIVKLGTGTQVFSGNNSYTAGTTVNAGTLLVNGQTGSESGTGSGAVTVNGGGTFGGTGRAAGAVTINSGGTVSGGDSGIGTLNIGGNLTFNSGAQQSFRITSAGTPAAVSTGGSSIGSIPNPDNNNFIDIGGSFLPLGDTATYQFVVDGTGATFNPNQSYSYQVGRVATDVVGPFVLNNQAQFSAIGFTDPFVFSLTGNGLGAVYLNIAPVPEPATVLALAAGALGAGTYLRRRWRREQV